MYYTNWSELCWPARRFFAFFYTSHFLFFLSACMVSSTIDSQFSSTLVQLANRLNGIKLAISFAHLFNPSQETIHAFLKPTNVSLYQSLIFL